MRPTSQTPLLARLPAIILGLLLSASVPFANAQTLPEVQRLMKEAKHRAHVVLMHNREALDHLAAELLKHETLEEEQVEKALEQAKLPAEAKLHN